MVQITLDDPVATPTGFRAGGTYSTDGHPLVSMSVRHRFAEEISGDVHNASNNGHGLIRIQTSNDHNLLDGDTVTIFDCLGTVEANGTWRIARINAHFFDLLDSAFVNKYIPGGKWTCEPQWSSQPPHIPTSGRWTWTANIDVDRSGKYDVDAHIVVGDEQASAPKKTVTVTL